MLLAKDLLGLRIPDEEQLVEENLLAAADWHFGASKAMLRRLGTRAPRALFGNGSLATDLVRRISHAALVYVGPTGGARLVRNLQRLAFDVMPRLWPRMVQYSLIVGAWDDLASTKDSWLLQLAADDRCMGIWVTFADARPHPKVRLRPLGMSSEYGAALHEIRLALSTRSRATSRGHEEVEAGKSGWDVCRGNRSGQLLGAHSVYTNTLERRSLHQLCIGPWASFCDWRCGEEGLCHSLHHGGRSLSKEARASVVAKFYEELCSYQFVLAPSGALHGSGRGSQQTHRLWEALAFGVVPVVLRGDLAPLLNGLSVLHLLRWTELSAELLRSVCAGALTHHLLPRTRTSCQLPLNIARGGSHPRRSMRYRKLVSSGAGGAADATVADLRWLREPPGPCTLWSSWWVARMRPEVSAPGSAPSICRQRLSSRHRRWSGALRPSLRLVSSFLRCREEPDASFLVVESSSTELQRAVGLCMPVGCEAQATARVANLTGFIAAGASALPAGDSSSYRREASSAPPRQTMFEPACWEKGLGPEHCCGDDANISWDCFADNSLILEHGIAVANVEESTVFVSPVAVRMLRDGCCRNPWASAEHGANLQALGWPQPVRDWPRDGYDIHKAFTHRSLQSKVQ